MSSSTERNYIRKVSECEYYAIIGGIAYGAWTNLPAANKGMELLMQLYEPNEPGK